MQHIRVSMIENFNNDEDCFAEKLHYRGIVGKQNTPGFHQFLYQRYITNHQRSYRFHQLSFWIRQGDII